MFWKILINTYDEKSNQWCEHYVIDACLTSFDDIEHVLINKTYQLVSSCDSHFTKDNVHIFIALDVDGWVPKYYEYTTLEDLEKTIGNMIKRYKDAEN